MSGIKITKMKNFTEIVKENRCSSCSGSGYYDSWDVKNDRPIKCGTCKGTGKK